MDASRIVKRKLRPFDAANHDDFSMYNKLPYYRDINLCTNDMITLVTGNVIKYFQYSINDTYTLSEIDNLAILKIQEYENREQKRLMPNEDTIIEDSIPLITDENEDSNITNQETVFEKKRPEYLDLDFE